VSLLQQIVLQLLQAVETRISFWRAFNISWHNYCSIATDRNESASTRSVIPVCRTIIAASQRASVATSGEEPAADPSSRPDTKKSQSVASWLQSAAGITGASPGGV